MSKKDVSVILCTWNNNQRLGITLNAFLECENPVDLSWELIVVDNNSTDNTKEVVNCFSGNLPVKYVFEKRQGLSAARNAGIKASNGELIIFTDDDIKPVKNWISVYWLAFQSSGTKTFWGGPIESEFEGDVPDSDLLAIAPSSVKGLSFGNSQRRLTDQESFLSANWAIRRKDLIDHGMFDLSLGLNANGVGVLKVGEETELMRRLKKNSFCGLYLPEAKIKHWVPSNKSTLEHIAARCEAGAVTDWYLYKFILDKFKIGPVFVGLYIQIFLKWLKWGIVRILGRNGIKEYVNFRVYLGILKGFYASR